MKKLKNFKQFINEEDKYLSDEEIEAGYDNFKIREFKINSEGDSGTIGINFPHNEDKFDNFIVYDNGHVAFDNWYPEKVYLALVKYIANNTTPKWKKKIKEVYSKAPYNKTFESMDDLENMKEYMRKNDAKLFKEFQTMKMEDIRIIHTKWNDLRKKALKKVNDELHSEGKGTIMSMDVSDDELGKYLSKEEVEDFFRYSRILDFKDGYKPIKESKEHERWTEYYRELNKKLEKYAESVGGDWIELKNDFMKEADPHNLKTPNEKLEIYTKLVSDFLKEKGFEN